MGFGSLYVTSVDNIVLMKIVDCTKNFTNNSGCILLGKLSILANSVEQLTTSG